MSETSIKIFVSVLVGMSFIVILQLLNEAGYIGTNKTKVTPPHDCFANAQSRIQGQAFGTGTYICTLAGAGRNSRCFKRFK